MTTFDDALLKLNEAAATFQNLSQVYSDKAGEIDTATAALATEAQTALTAAQQAISELQAKGAAAEAAATNATNAAATATDAAAAATDATTAAAAATTAATDAATLSQTATQAATDAATNATQSITAATQAATAATDAATAANTAAGTATTAATAAATAATAATDAAAVANTAVTATTAATTSATEAAAAATAAASNATTATTSATDAATTATDAAAAADALLDTVHNTQRFYVDSSESTNGTGTPSSPFNNLKSALDLVKQNVSTEIWLASGGTYSVNETGTATSWTVIRNAGVAIEKWGSSGNNPILDVHSYDNPGSTTSNPTFGFLLYANSNLSFKGVDVNIRPSPLAQGSFTTNQFIYPNNFGNCGIALIDSDVTIPLGKYMISCKSTAISVAIALHDSNIAGGGSLIVNSPRIPLTINLSSTTSLDTNSYLVERDYSDRRNLSTNYVGSQLLRSPV